MSTQLKELGRVGQVSTARENADIPPALGKTGARIAIDQVLQWAIDGHTFHAQQGNADSLLDWNNTTYAERQPEFALLVPAGRTVIPLSLVLNIQDQPGTDNHYIWSTATNNVGIGASTALTITPMRTRPTTGFGSACSARSKYSGNADVATGLIEVIRFFDAYAVVATGPTARFAWNFRSAAAVPVLVGPATLQLHLASGTKAEGFGEYVWAEFDTKTIVET